MKVKMLKTVNGTENGILIKEYAAGNIYDIKNESLVEDFISLGAIELVDGDLKTSEETSQDVDKALHKKIEMLEKELVALRENNSQQLSEITELKKSLDEAVNKYSELSDKYSELTDKYVEAQMKEGDQEKNTNDSEKEKSETDLKNKALKCAPENKSNPPKDKK